MFDDQFFGVTTIHGDHVLINMDQVTHVVFTNIDGENANIHLVGSDKIVVVPRSELIGRMATPPTEVN